MTDANPAVLPTARDVVVDDTDPNIHYDGGGWTGALSANRTIHWSAQADAQFSYSYQGSDVWFYGDMGPAHGAFGVLVDDFAYPAGSQFAPGDAERAQVMLYHVPLDRGRHTLTVMNLNETRLGLDFLVYRPMSELPSLQSSNTSRDRVASSTWVAIVLGVICLILLVLLSITLFLLHRRQRTDTSTDTSSSRPAAQSAAKPPTTGIDPFPIRYQAPPAPPDSATIVTSTGTGGPSSAQPSQVDVTTRSNAVAVDIPHNPGDVQSSRPEPDWLRANRLVLYQGPTG